MWVWWHIGEVIIVLVSHSSLRQEKEKIIFSSFFLICLLKILASLYICIILPSIKCIGNWKFPRKYGVKKRLFKFLKTTFITLDESSNLYFAVYESRISYNVLRAKNLNHTWKSMTMTDIYEYLSICTLLLSKEH